METVQCVSDRRVRVTVPQSVQKISAEAKGGQCSAITGSSEEDVASVWEAFPPTAKSRCQFRDTTVCIVWCLWSVQRYYNMYSVVSLVRSQILQHV